ncbi:haloacid dehalogenase-like hydrolase [Ktedonosporobacter rubrisoli]|uniref:Haloacid dehalogenase-like hydrolase n=1 Tax=Ktedonosporobacter rubrisoli TaxID=2509675 RepID=A0A4P6JMV0_KTERU|nr:haloacid dehalogenase-like hydrolase [Ktedonosporobacter rubrisoli]QBD76585.1 haloacid dehalogenase-like hydrolase [Ktedonosporobacter rubrisoli]
MHKRYLDCNASELRSISKPDLLDALRASEGRIVVSETIGAVQPLLQTITNAELAASQGADVLLLNLLDVDTPAIHGMPAGIEPEDIIHALQHLTGRVIGVNLEAVDPAFRQEQGSLWDIKEGRVASARNAQKLLTMGAKFIVLTGNPGNGITNSAITSSLQEIHAAVGEKIILVAGKMHAAGVLSEGGESILTLDDITEFRESGADIILLPAPGTVPGITLEYARGLIVHAHKLGAMAMTAIGTSQEGANIETIRHIALMCKMAGADLHHIGDTGYVGIALPENINAYSIAIRGIRHTYARMARSVNR